MKNEYGFNVHYFKGKLERVLQGIDRYTPDEFAREMARMSVTADEKVMREPEFSSKAMASVEKQYDALPGKADALAYECAKLISSGVLDMRSGVADELLDYLEIGSGGHASVPEWISEYEMKQVSAKSCVK